MTRRTRREPTDTPEEIVLPGQDFSPLAMHNAFVLAVSIAATQERAYLKCQRRECRSYGRCRAAPPRVGRGSFCAAPLGAEAIRRIEGMFLFALQLANGWR